jgi:hypothetical protein
MAKVVVKKQEDDKSLLTVEEALALLSVHTEKRKKRVHTFVVGSGILLGCDMDLTSIKKAFKETKHLSLAGPNMSGFGHGVAFHDEKVGYTFVETDKDKLEVIQKERGL